MAETVQVHLTQSRVKQLFALYFPNLSPPRSPGKYELDLGDGEVLVLTPLPGGGYRAELDESFHSLAPLVLPAEIQQCPLCHEEVRPGQRCNSILCMLLLSAYKRYRARSFRYTSQAAEISAIRIISDDDEIQELFGTQNG